MTRLANLSDAELDYQERCAEDHGDLKMLAEIDTEWQQRTAADPDAYESGVAHYPRDLEGALI